MLSDLVGSASGSSNATGAIGDCHADRLEVGVVLEVRMACTESDDCARMSEHNASGSGNTRRFPHRDGGTSEALPVDHLNERVQWLCRGSVVRLADLVDVDKTRAGGSCEQRSDR